MSVTLTGAQRQVVAKETLASIGINALGPTAIIWLVDLRPPRGLWGAEGLVSDMLKATGVATLLMTTVVTLLVRRRVREGQVAAAPPAALTLAEHWAPRTLLARAPLMALIAMALLTPAGATAATLMRVLPLNKTGFAVFNVVFGAFVGLIMTPAVVRRALADPAGADPAEADPAASV